MLVKGKYRHVPVHSKSMRGYSTANRLSIYSYEHRFQQRSIYKANTKENSDVSSLFPESFLFTLLLKKIKTSKPYPPERVETQPCFFIESNFHLVIAYSCTNCMVVTQQNIKHRLHEFEQSVFIYLQSVKNKGCECQTFF